MAHSLNHAELSRRQLVAAKMAAEAQLNIRTKYTSPPVKSPIQQASDETLVMEMLSRGFLVQKIGKDL